MMMSKGFQRNGWDVSYYDYREAATLYNPTINQEQVLKTIVDIQPDILFLNKCEKLDPQIISKARMSGWRGKAIFWHMDQRKRLIPSVIAWSKQCDWVFHCKGASRLKEFYEATKVPTSFLFAPYEPSYIHSIPFSDRLLQTTWYGQLYDPQKGFDSIRRDNIPYIRNLLDDYGACFDKTFIRGIEYYTQLGNSKTSISIPAIDMPYYFSNRHSHIMGSGAIPLSYRFENCYDMFTEGVDIITFKNCEELQNKILYYLNNIDLLYEMHLHVVKFAKKYLVADAVYREIMYTLQNGESSYPFGQTINPDKRKIL